MEPEPASSPKLPFPWLALILTNLASLIVGLVLAKFILVQPASLGSPKPSAQAATPTPAWQTYTNPQSGLQFSYPASFDLSNSTTNSNSPMITLTERA